jgi:hypothetical protein
VTPLASAKVFFSAGMILGSKIDNDFKTDIAGGEEQIHSSLSTSITCYEMTSMYLSKLGRFTLRYT